MPQDRENLVSLAIFEGSNIRQIWHDDQWHFSVIDMIRAVAESSEPSKYWTAMKARVQKEGGVKLSTLCRRLKLPSSDGKNYLTDCANTENMLHIVQYIPSKKAVPFREWLAQVGAERLEEIADPEQAFAEWEERAVRSYMASGYSEAWARNRIDSIVARKSLTGEWALRGIRPEEYPILTDRLHMGEFGISIEQHKDLKGYPVIHIGNRAVHKGDLRPGMTAMELAVATFGDNVARALHIEQNSHGFHAIAADVDQAGAIARDKRLEIEHVTGKPVISPTNMLNEPDGGLWGMLPAPEDA